MITKFKIYKQVNEGIRDEMKPVSEEQLKKSLEKLSDNKKIEKILINNLPYEWLPRNNGQIIYDGNLNVAHKDISVLPDNLVIKGNFNCSYNKLKTLPKNLKVDGNLECYVNEIETIPNDIQVGGSIANKAKLILTTFQTVTPESAEDGDFADQGWIDDVGENVIPDQYESEDGITAVDKALDFLENKGANEPSSSHFHPNIYYSTNDPETNYRTGEETYYTLSLKGFTEKEEEEIFNRMTGKTNESLLLEKSSLTKLGVPREVMQPIQKDLALSTDAEWERVDHKKDILKYLRKGDKNLFIQVAVDSIKMFGSYPSIKGTLYFIDNYIYRDTEWAGEYEKLPRQYKSFTQLSIDIEPRTNIYRLKGDFEINTQGKRKMIKKENSFIEFSERFKTDFLQQFDKVLKKITGPKYEKAKKQVIDKAKRIEVENKLLIKSLDNPLNGPNGLSILDEFLYKFEDIYSEYFGERIDIQELAKYFTYEKVMTMFMYYIYTGKLLVK